MELHKISEEICIKHDAAKERNKQLGVLLKGIVLPSLQKDPLFKALFTEIFYTGSYYDGVKIGKPDEFDLILKLRPPFDADLLEFRYERNNGGQLKIVNMRYLLNQSTNEINTKLIEWCGINGGFDSQQMLSWFKDIVKKFLIPELEKNRSIMLRNNLHYDKMNFGGFAFTFESKEFSIDLVPAFEFKVPYTPKVFAPYNVRKLPKPILPWFLTPGFKTSNWKMCMKEYEMRLLKNGINSNLKPAIRLIKILTELYDRLIKNNTLSYWTCRNDDGVLQTLKTKKIRRELGDEIGECLRKLQSAVELGDDVAVRKMFQ
ncbi:hypothetical protein B566_EDAN013029 [Ephemera danica]|nr:hypothetical protein B566_EDAN013029 [Ephemera danica]